MRVKSFILLSICVTALAGVGIVIARQTISPSAVKGQRNTSLTFYGKVVDQDGLPLSGAEIEYRIEAYPKEWAFDNRLQANDASFSTFTSGPDGSFQAKVEGCTMRMRSARYAGYTLLAENDLSDSTENTRTQWYCLIAQGDLWFKSDRDHPAVYVFVKDGVKEVSALPCHGGYSSGGSLIWKLNEPGWPKQPSLKDVVQKFPATAPTTKPNAETGSK